MNNGLPQVSLFIQRCLWGRNSWNQAGCSLFIAQLGFWKCSGKTPNVLIIPKFNDHHSVPILYDLSVASDTLTAPACSPPQLSGHHSTGLSLTTDSHQHPCRHLFLHWALKICCCPACCPQQIIHPEFYWLYLNLLTTGEILNEGQQDKGRKRRKEKKINHKLAQLHLWNWQPHSQDSSVYRI